MYEKNFITGREDPETLSRKLGVKYGWVELNRLVISVRETPTISRTGVITLMGDQDFMETIDSVIELDRSPGITGLFMMVTGSEIVPHSHSALEELFQSLTIDISIRGHDRSVALIRDGNVNKNDITIMGKLRKWVMYSCNRWSIMEVTQCGEIPVTIEVSGTTRPAVEGEAVIALFISYE